MTQPNFRAALDAGGALCLHTRRRGFRASERGRYAAFTRSMKYLRIPFVVASIALSRNVSGQSFINFDFEDSIVTSSQPAWSFAGNTGMANMPGWTEFNGWGDSNYSGGASVIYNNQTLDSPNVSIWDAAYPNPAIQGNFSIFLYGGSAAYAGVYPGLPTGASVFQTGQIPNKAKSISYWGSSYNGLQVTFNGQVLTFINTGNAAHYSVWSADISAYAGQTGQLVFTAPWLSGGILDNIQFSSSQIPEPTVLRVFSVGVISLLWWTKRPNHRRQRTPRLRAASILRQRRGAAAAERYTPK